MSHFTENLRYDACDYTLGNYHQLFHKIIKGELIVDNALIDVSPSNIFFLQMHSSNKCFQLKDFTKVFILLLAIASINGLLKLLFQLSSLSKLMKLQSRLCILENCKMSLIE